jgi:RHH-type rel operon transcriptional repressor/antitoxin RelB
MSTLDKALNVRLPEQLHAQLTELTRVTGRSKSFLAIEALEAYISHQSWQIAEVQAGIEEANRGEFASDEQMRTIFEKYAS